MSDDETYRRDWVAHWSSASWREQATAWAREQVAARGARIEGEVEAVRVRAWSAHLRVPTTDGVAWLKALNPGMSAEPALVATLDRLVPGCVVSPWAVDAERAWMLTPDQGATLREGGDPDPGSWSRLVGDFGALQRALVPHEHEVRGAGVGSLAAADAATTLGSYVRAVTEAARACEQEPPSRLGDLERLAARADDALAGEVACTLDHNDLHDNNAFAPTGESGTAFFDLADAVWGHPFAVLRTPLDVLRGGPGSTLDDRAMRRLADSYLEGWSDLGGHRWLRAELERALVVSRVHQLDAWCRLLPHCAPWQLPELLSYVDGVLGAVEWDRLGC